MFYKVKSFWLDIVLNLPTPGAYSEPSQASNMELFVKTIKFQPSTVFTKASS